MIDYCYSKFDLYFIFEKVEGISLCEIVKNWNYESPECLSLEYKGFLLKLLRQVVNGLMSIH